MSQEVVSLRTRKPAGVLSVRIASRWTARGVTRIWRTQLPRRLESDGETGSTGESSKGTVPSFEKPEPFFVGALEGECRLAEVVARGE